MPAEAKSIAKGSVYNTFLRFVGCKVQFCINQGIGILQIYGRRNNIMNSSKKCCDG